MLERGYAAQYQFGSTRFDVEPYALITREDDVQFTSFVYWIVSAIFYAEEQDITQNRANRMDLVNLFGSAFSDMFRSAISSVGNYAEIYQRNAEFEFPRSSVNNLNVQLGGPQHYPIPGVVRDGI